MSYTHKKGAIKSVKNWLEDKLINWDSYQSLEWSDVVQINVPPYMYVIHHQFKHHNDKGFIDRCSVTFYLDKTFKVVNFHRWQQAYQ
jgi:hypothetical protein